MTNSSRNPKWPGDLDKDAQRLKSLQTEVAKVRAEDAAAEAAAFDPAKPSTGMGLGLKMGMDLTVATLIGFGLGALIDWLLGWLIDGGTFPLMALILCVLGFAAGIRMVLASANTYQKRLEEYAAEKSDMPPPEDD